MHNKWIISGERDCDIHARGAEEDRIFMPMPIGTANYLTHHMYIYITVQQSQLIGDRLRLERLGELKVEDGLLCTSWCHLAAGIN